MLLNWTKTNQKQMPFRTELAELSHSSLNDFTTSQNGLGTFFFNNAYVIFVAMTLDLLVHKLKKMS